MENRNPLLVIIFSLITLGIYALYWFVVTKREMNSIGATIPTAWLIIIPLVNIYWLWKYCEGVEAVTKGKLGAVLAFILIFILFDMGILLGFVAMAIVQNAFNQIPRE